MFEKVFIFVIICTSFMKFAVSNYEHISERSCIFHVSSLSYQILFTCGEINKENEILNTGSEITCYSGNAFCTAIKFSDCRFRKIEHNFFEKFANLNTFDISGVELEKFETKTLRNATNLQTLFVSYNQLSEISSQLFINAVEIETVDFSNNVIERIHSLAFEKSFS